MRILSFNWHTPYLSLLARLPYRFEVAPPNIESDVMKSWNESMRPLTANLTPITKNEMKERLREQGRYDLIIAHNVKDIIATREVNVPKILVFHNRLSTEAALGKQPDIVGAYREKVRKLTAGVHCVFISEYKRDDWGLPGELILPGVDTSMYGRYTGEIRQVLRVGNSIRSRDLMTGYSLQEEVVNGLPNILVGENPDIPASKVSDGWDGLKKAYRQNRVYLNTPMPPWEDGYNLALLEASATGAPVVSVVNPTCPITDGVDGFVADNPAGLREKVINLLDNHALAISIGAEGKRMIERKFPISTFLEKWDFIIQNTAGDRRGLPARVTVQREFKKFRKLGPGKKNALLSYTSYPATTGNYIERAFRAQHNLVTTGGKITQFVIDRWNLRNLKEKAHEHDIPTAGFTVDMEQVFRKIPDGFEPDFFLWVETGLDNAPAGLEKLACPTAAYLIDTHIHTDRHIAIAGGFDVVFLAQRAYIPEFLQAGVKNVHWLPLACDPEIHGKIDMEKKRDIGFVGSLTTLRRISLLLKLAEKFDVGYDRAFMREMTDFFCASRLVFNNAIRDDLNMRVFEALCSGSMLLTDHADGMEEFFKDREHLAIYEDGNIADIAGYYLDHHEEMIAISEAGRRLVLEKHTYGQRVAQVVKTIEDFTNQTAQRR